MCDRYHLRFFEQVGHETKYAEVGIHNFFTKYTGKSLSEALIFASINPKYDNRLFMVIP